MHKLLPSVVLMLLAVSVNSLAAEKFTITYSNDSLLGKLQRQIITAVYQEAGIEHQWVFEDQARMMVAANKGLADAASFRVRNGSEIFTNLIPLQLPHYSVQVTTFAGEPHEIDAWADLADYRHCYIKGFLVAQRHTQGFQSKEVDSLDQCFKLLKGQRIDLVIASRASAAEYLAAGEDLAVFANPHNLADVPVFHFLNNKHTDLVPVLSSALQNLIEQKKIQQIIDEALGEQ